MGLDMYLTKKIYIGANYEHRRISGDIRLYQDNNLIPVCLKKITYICEDVGYWRKANQVHGWFVNNVQDGNDDCGTYSVSANALDELLSTCKKVLASSKLVFGTVTNGYTFDDEGNKVFQYIDGMVIEDCSVAQQLLPCQDGFFYGSTQYDEGYIAVINDTVDILENIFEDISMTNNDGANYEFEYTSSW